MDPAASSLNLDQHLAGAGVPAASLAHLWQRLWSQPYLPAALLELCRLNLARLHRDELELGALNPHAVADAREQARRELVRSGGAAGNPLFSPLEQAVLEFCECYALDPQSIDDAVADAVSRRLGEPGLVFLIEALGLIDARIRSARCLRDLARAEQTEVRDGH